MPKWVADSGTIEITATEWLDELVRLGRKNDAGHTRRELSNLWNVSDKMALKRLQQASDLGRLVVGKRSISRLDGAAATVPVYTITPAGKKR